MKTNTILIAGWVIFTGVIIAVVVNVKRPTPPVAAPVVATTPAPSTAPPPEVSSVPKISPTKIITPAPTQPANPLKSNVTVKAATQPNPAQAGQPLTINGYAVQDPAARVALNFVGADSAADTYWASAINNPNLPSEERKDLIEDLNEDGLSDPQHPGSQDLPLILNRLQLIEELGPYSMDQVNADAFAEAYKDLVGMANGQTPQ